MEIQIPYRRMKMTSKEKKTTSIYNYKSMRMLIDDFAKYGSIEFRGVEKGRMEAIDALVYLMHRYYCNRGYMITKDFIVTADYSPKRLPKRYNYGIVYNMVFTLNIDGKPFQTVTDVKFDGEAYSVSTKDVTFVFNANAERMRDAMETEEVKYDNGEQTEGDMAVDEEEVSEPEVQGLPPLREEGHPRVSRVARL